MKAENLEEQEGKNLSVKAENLRVRGNQSNRKSGEFEGSGAIRLIVKLENFKGKGQVI